MWLFPWPSSLVHTMVVLSSRLPLPPGSGVSASRFARYAICSQYQWLILVSFSCASLLLSGSCDSACCPSLTPSHRIFGSPTEFVYCNVATRVKSARKLFTISSTCILLIFGMLSFSSRTPGSSSGILWPMSFATASAFSSASISRTNAAWSSSNLRSAALTAPATFFRSAFRSSSTLARAALSFFRPYSLLNIWYGLSMGVIGLFAPAYTIRVQVSARSGTMTPNSSDPNRVFVAASCCSLARSSWSMLSPEHHPAGVSDPPWMLPGNSSMPVSMHPMPRMCPSPSPRTLLLSPFKNSSLSLNGSSGWTIGLSLKSLPTSSGQKFHGTVPSGENTTSSRCLRLVWLSNARPGRLPTNGSTAALTPRVRRKSRRDARGMRCSGNRRGGIDFFAATSGSGFRSRWSRRRQITFGQSVRPRLPPRRPATGCYTRF